MVLLVSILCTSILSSEMDSTLQKLPEMVVKEKLPFGAKTTGATVTVNSTAIENSLADHAGEILNRTAGFTIRDGYQVPLQLRGLPGRAMLVLRNDNRRFSSYPAGYMTHTTNVYELEKIEVLKGASSVLYGAGAIAGTINLIDRDPLKGSSGLSGKSGFGYNSNNEQFVMLEAAQWSGKRAGFRTAVRIREAGDYTNADKSIAENSSFKDKDVTINVAVLPTDLTRFDLRADIHRGGPWERPRGFTGTKYMLASTPVENSTNLSLSFERQGNSTLQFLKGSVFYSAEYRKLHREYYAAANMMKTYEETTSFWDSYFGMQINATTKLSKKLKLNSGIEAYRFSISAPSRHNDYVANLTYKNRNSINARSTTAGLYSEIIANPVDGFSITAGGRYDLSTLYEGEVYNLSQNEGRNAVIDAGSGALGIRIVQGLLIGKVNFARSFRVPQTNELFTDSHTSRGLMLANPELQPEYCYSLDAVVQVPGKYISVEIDPFFWFFDDMISREEVRGTPGTVYTYTNIGKARLCGGEALVSLTLNDLLFTEDQLLFRVSGAIVSGRDLSNANEYFDRGDPLDFIPPPNARSELSYYTTLGKTFTFDVGINLMGYADNRHLPQGAYTSPGFVTMGVAGGLKWHKNIFTVHTQIAVINLLNETYYSFQSYLPAPGRDVRIMTSIKVR